jgi:uncharacterized protein (TIGR02246 family)
MLARKFSPHTPFFLEALMQGRIYLIAGLLGTTLGACASARVDTASEEQRIRELDRQWVQAVANRDVAGSTAVYAPDAVFLLPNMPPARGMEAIRKEWTGMLGMPNLQLTFAPTQIVVSEAGDMATDVGTYQFSFDGPQGRVSDRGKYSVVWRKINGEWKVVSDMINSDMPLPAPPPPPPPQRVEVPVVFDNSMDPEIHAAKGLQWNAITPPGFKPGMQLAVIHGDPAGKGDYTIRLRFPAGYEFPPHWHPNAEHVTVLQGTFLLAMGDRFDRTKLQEYTPGDFLYAPAKKPHFGGVRGATVIQLHGIGPFDIQVVQ